MRVRNLSGDYFHFRSLGRDCLDQCSIRLYKPDKYKGAGRLRTVFVVILPSAIPGILAGVILAIGRITGETAALIYTAGTVPGIPTTKLAGVPIFDMMSSGRTLAIHMYALLNEGLYMEQAYATAVVLLVMVLLINALSAFIAKKFTRS